MSIAQPYLLFLGDVSDPIAAKTARGIALWRPESCVGQLRLSEETVSLSLADLSLEQAQALGAKTLIIGTANAGGVIPASWQATLIQAAQMGFEIASGMHSRLSDITALKSLQERGITRLHDVRHFDQALNVGTGKKRQGKRVLTVGTDCSVGKMFTALALEKALKARSIDARFKATGQTGILIQGSGISIDAVVADFISGAVEAISPDFTGHDWDIIEGQGSLFNPSFAGVSLGLLHGAQADALILCHEVARPHIRHLPHCEMPSIEQTISANLAAAKLTNQNVQLAGISLNTSALNQVEALDLCQQWQRQYQVPVTDPVRFGIDAIAQRICEL